MANVPLRIEWTVVTPWCPSPFGLHLDGLIAHAMVQAAGAEGRVLASFDEIHDDLPFEKHHTESGWVWKASLVKPRQVFGSERRYMTAKTASIEMAERMVDGRIAGRVPARIDLVRGPFKNDAFWYGVETIGECVAYCVGDPDRIVPLLDHVTHLGKRARLDHGRLDPDKTAVHEDEEALRYWQNRSMPEPLDGYVPAHGRLRPPYWQGEYSTVVYRPI